MTNTFDISAFMQDFLNLFVEMLRQIYNILSSIQFFGFSLLTYFIALFVLLACIPLVISIINTQSTKTKGTGEVILRKSRNVSKRIDKGLADYDDMINDLRD